MTDAPSAARTRNSRVVRASPEALYRAFLDPEGLVVWLPPDAMTGKIHCFDAQVGGGYRMSLYYPESEREFRGKTTDREDRVNVRFVELVPSKKIVQGVIFESPDPAFAGEMNMAITFEPVEGGTEVGIACWKIPSGIRPEDNEAGCRSTLGKLARYLETR